MCAAAATRLLITVDCAIFGVQNDELQLLVLRREKAPFAGKWSLPGGIIRADETAEQCAVRILQEKTGLKGMFLEQLYTFSDVKRDPRGRVVSIAYFALIRPDQFALFAGRDTSEIAWKNISDLPALGFDHNTIASVALTRLKAKVRYQPVGFELLAPVFTLTQLQNLYETILGYEIDKRNFRKKILGMGLLDATGKKEVNVKRRAAELYRFNKQKYQSLTRKGFSFEL
jgi:8-oxo-dGTP diphosphatase